MTLRHLRIFVAVADCGKMSLAAKRLFISQPTVSQAVAELESYYGSRFFERLNKKLFITEAGQQLLSYARHILALYDEMELQLQYTSEHRSLKVGATITVGICLLTEMINAFEAGHPSFQVDAYVDNTSVIEDKLLRSELDLGLVEGRIKSPDILATPFMEDELVLICGPGHPLAQAAKVTAGQLQGQPFILRERGSGTRELFMGYLQEHGVEVYEKWECHSSASIKSAVAGGQGLSVLSRRLVEQEAQTKQLHILSLEDAKLVRPFSLAYHKNKFLSPPIRALMEQCHILGRQAGS